MRVFCLRKIKTSRLRSQHRFAPPTKKQAGEEKQNKTERQRVIHWRFGSGAKVGAIAATVVVATVVVVETVAVVVVAVVLICMVFLGGTFG